MNAQLKTLGARYAKEISEQTAMAQDLVGFINEEREMELPHTNEPLTALDLLDYLATLGIELKKITTEPNIPSVSYMTRVMWESEKRI